MPRPRLLILSFTDARNDPRVLRQASYLREDYAVTLAGLGDPGLEGVDFMPVHRRPKTIASQGWGALHLLLGNSGPASRRFALSDPENAAGRRFDLALVDDAEPLPLGFRLAKGAPVVFDAHEYYPKEFEHSLAWRLLFQRYMTKLCQEYIPRCAGMTTVCPGIAQEYHRAFGTLPEVVHNGPEYQYLSPNAVAPDVIRLIHHGVANPDRRIECMIETMDHVDGRFTLDLYLVGTGEYITKIRRMAESRANVNWRESVPMRELSGITNKYDIGLCLIAPTTFNNVHMLPNKFFEYIQGRLGVAVGPSPEMASIAREYELGVVADDFTPKALAAKLNALSTEDIMRFKRNADKAAHIYNADASMETLKRLLQEIVTGKDRSV